MPGRTEGVRWRGELDPESLAPLGWQRAGALVQFFEQPTAPHIERPDHLFAVSFDRARIDSSRRSKQTLRPLSQKLGLPVNHRLGKEQEKRLVQTLAALSGTVLVAWSHENIRLIGDALGASALTPSTWPDERFDVVWVFDR
ncbi:MAG: histidine phosphatase family protein, partial [Burkholderiales bacterium]